MRCRACSAPLRAAEGQAFRLTLRVTERSTECTHCRIEGRTPAGNFPSPARLSGTRLTPVAWATASRSAEPAAATTVRVTHSVSFRLVQRVVTAVPPLTNERPYKQRSQRRADH